MDSKSYRVYNAEARRVQESQSVIFVNTPSVMPPPDVGGYDDGEFTYDGHDMVRDVRNYTFNRSIDSLSPDHAVWDPPLIYIVENNRETADRDLGLSPARSSPPADSAPGPSRDAPGVDSPASPGGVRPPAPGVVAPPPVSPPSGAAPTGSSSPSPVTPLGSSPSGSAPFRTPPRGGPAQWRDRGGRGGSSRGGSARGGSTSRGGRGSTGWRGCRGGRGPPPARPVTRSVAKQPNAKAISEIRRLSYTFTVKGEFPDVAHWDGSF